MDMKNRIRQLMESQKMTQQMFANFIGMSTATLSSIFNERTKPTLNTVEAIRTKFPNINIDWLMFGNGTMFNNENGEIQLPTPPEDYAGEQSLMFEGNDSKNENKPATMPQTSAIAETAKKTKEKNTKVDIAYTDNCSRRITEIRVFFDDLTYESFVPRK